MVCLFGRHCFADDLAGTSPIHDLAVASCLRGKPVLDSATLKWIAMDTARRPLYMLEQCVLKIFLHDVKAASVLLVKNHKAAVQEGKRVRLWNHGTVASHGTVRVQAWQDDRQDLRRSAQPEGRPTGFVDASSSSITAAA
jgi:hypothetical protein